MFDAFNAWNRMMTAGWSMTQTGMRMAETIGAANEVMAARATLIGSAIHSPLTSDHRELARMVPEKVDAFSRMGSATVAAWWTAQSAWVGEMQHLSAMAMRGRPITATELAALGARMTARALESVEAAAQLGSSALAPVHRKATANAKRLRRKAARRIATNESLRPIG